MHGLQPAAPSYSTCKGTGLRDDLGTASALLGGGGALDVACRDTASASEVQVFGPSQGSLGSQIHGTRQLSALLPPTPSIWNLTSVGCQAFCFLTAPPLPAEGALVSSSA